MDSLRKRCLLAIWLDGFRTDYLNKDDTPFLFELSQNSIVGEYQPLLSFEGLGVSILTGINPLRHGVFTEFCYDPEGSPYKWQKKFVAFSKCIDRFVGLTGSRGHLLRAGLHYSLFKFSNRLNGRRYMPIAKEAPFQVMHLFKPSIEEDLLLQNTLSAPTIFDYLKQQGIPYRSLSQAVLDDSAIYDQAMKVDVAARLFFFQLVELDTVGHSKGPKSRELKASLRKIDHRVERIVDEHRKKMDVDLFVFSDHGMVEVNNICNIAKYLRRFGLVNGKHFIMFLDSTIARFWVPNLQVKQAILGILNSVEGGSVLSAYELHKYGVPINRKYGDIFWLADAGSLILPNYYQGSTMAHGMHGYAPEAEGLRSPFLIWRQGIHPKVVKQIATPMDIFATMESLLGIKVPWQVDGTPLNCA